MKCLLCTSLPSMEIHDVDSPRLAENGALALVHGVLIQQNKKNALLYISLDRKITYAIN